MAVSSSSLFHFTDSIDKLLSILRHNFRPHYSLEDYNMIFPTADLEVLELAIPMVSFCDIPLSSIEEHTEKYGTYAIGLTKEWGKYHGISPVLYTHKDSLLTTFIYDLIGKFTAFEVNERTELYNIFRFLKPCDGNLWRGGRVTRSINFYNEREWRYVPKDHRELLPKENYKDNNIREEENKKVWDKYNIYFEPNDIRYLIVEKEEEILSFVKQIEDLKGSKYSLDDVKILITRVISYERIKEDF